MPQEPKQKKPYKLEDRNGRLVRVYASGAVLDHATGRIAAPITGTVITPQTAHEHVERKRELKRQAVAAGAQAIVDQGVTLSGAKGADWVQAVAEAAAVKALNPDDAKQIDAARFLLQESGLAEPKQQQAPAHVAEATAGAVLGAVAALADVFRDVMDAKRREQAVDGELVQERASGAGEKEA